MTVSGHIKNKVLLVDDEEDITEILGFNLKSEGFDVDIVHSAEEALTKDFKDYNLILLDIMMGGMSGYKLAEAIRDKGIRTPIIFLTAKDTENDLLTGFSVGGDDYISKPFSIKEVIARMKAVLKRSEKLSDNPKATDQLIFGDDFIVDFDLKEVFINKEKVALTKTEFEILSLLINEPNQIFSRERIINTLWSETPYITERTVDVHITRLRKKLGAFARFIANRQGYGYFFNYSD